MLKRFRLNGRTSSAADENTASTRSSHRTFFDLPAELRNAIYEQVANCTLHINPSNSPTSPFPGLLLASRQCRKEYASILFSAAEIEARITDMNFKKLLRTIPNLDEISRQALASNPHLLIVLRLRKCGSEVYGNLRTWCEAQSAPLSSFSSFSPKEEEEEGEEERQPQPLPKWHYTISDKTEASPAQLDWYCGRIRVLEQRAQSVMRGRGKREARRILEVVERERMGKAAAGSWNSGFGDAYALYAATATRRT